MHRCEHEPLYFGSSGNNRFDAPDGQFGILYVAADAHCAFIETFGQSTGICVVTATALTERCLSRIETNGELLLVDLTGSGLARLGADERLCAGDHSVAQRWALALWAHPSRPDGLLYRARHDPSRLAIALYDRSAKALRVASQGNLLDPRNTALLADILDTYSFGLLSH